MLSERRRWSPPTLPGLEAGERLAEFSYGSGFGAEILTLETGPDAAAGAWTEDVEEDLASRRHIDAGSQGELLEGRLAKIA